MFCWFYTWLCFLFNSCYFWVWQPDFVSFVLFKLQCFHKVIDPKKTVSYTISACQTADLDQFYHKRIRENSDFTHFPEVMKKKTQNKTFSKCFALGFSPFFMFFSTCSHVFSHVFPRVSHVSQAFAVEMGKDLDLCGSTATVALIPKSRGDPVGQWLIHKKSWLLLIH